MLRRAFSHGTGVSGSRYVVPAECVETKSAGDPEIPPERNGNLYNFDFTLSHDGGLAPMIDQRASALLNELKTAYQLQAMQRTTQASEPVITDQEREAANLVVESVGGVGRGGRGGRGGGGRGRDGRGGDGRRGLTLDPRSPRK